ncbi:hypothetical protein Nepgr_003862 [Nepenthes gracilis]|uniref:Uncharacterized protein n=1 Tax=Nepenthes gracilis TaxID=150966 RepID=A0AAD3XEA7_NEPGR|nr:hypothetical protein Nepgr_003862 [Nepenthes gracilis]
MPGQHPIPACQALYRLKRILSKGSILANLPSCQQQQIDAIWAECEPRSVDVLTWRCTECRTMGKITSKSGLSSIPAKSPFMPRDPGKSNPTPIQPNTPPSKPGRE